MLLMFMNIIDDIYIVLFIVIYVFYWNFLMCDVVEMDINLDFFYGLLDYGFISYVDSFLSGGKLVIVRFVVGKNVWVKKIE